MIKPVKVEWSETAYKISLYPLLSDTISFTVHFKVKWKKLQ